MPLRPFKIVPQQEGSALIELAIIMPVLILMLLGALDIGLILRQAMIVAGAARAGAVYGSMWSSASDTANMQAYANFEATNNNIPNVTAVAVTSCTCGVGGASVPCNGSCIGNIQPVQYAQVTVTANLPIVFGVSGFPATVPVKSIAKYRVSWKGGN